MSWVLLNGSGPVFGGTVVYPPSPVEGVTKRGSLSPLATQIVVGGPPREPDDLRSTIDAASGRRAIRPPRTIPLAPPEETPCGRRAGPRP
ncbi:MAG: hypothetical protein V1790_11080 [Planctomycetota bacterium]